MFSFFPKKLNRVLRRTEELFSEPAVPAESEPSDPAERPMAPASEPVSEPTEPVGTEPQKESEEDAEKRAWAVLEKVREGKTDFAALSGDEFRLCYWMAELCEDEEYERLKTAAAARFDLDLVQIGWRYVQEYPNRPKAAGLYLAGCEWLEQAHPDVFRTTLVSQTGYRWEVIWERAAEIMKIKKLSLHDFCTRFHVGSDTPFMQRVLLCVFARCDRAYFEENEALFIRLVHFGPLSHLRFAVKNYVSKFRFEEIPEAVRDALTYRVAVEPAGETLGLAPGMLKQLRNVRFCSVLGECVDVDSQKNTVYNSVSEMARNIELLENRFFVIDFGKYKVVDNTDWTDFAYAYTADGFEEVLARWRAAGSPEDFWPGVAPEEIAEAKDIVLGLGQKRCVRLGFSGFDLLYTRDLLSVARF